MEAARPGPAPGKIKEHRGGAYGQRRVSTAFASSRPAALRHMMGLPHKDDGDGDDEDEDLLSAKAVYSRLRRFDRDNKGFISHDDLRLTLCSESAHP